MTTSGLIMLKTKENRSERIMIFDGLPISTPRNPIKGIEGILSINIENKPIQA